MKTTQHKEKKYFLLLVKLNHLLFFLRQSKKLPPSPPRGGLPGDPPGGGPRGRGVGPPRHPSPGPRFPRPPGGLLGEVTWGSKPWEKGPPWPTKVQLIFWEKLLKSENPHIWPVFIKLSIFSIFSLFSRKMQIFTFFHFFHFFRFFRFFRFFWWFSDFSELVYSFMRTFRLQRTLYKIFFGTKVISNLYLEWPSPWVNNLITLLNTKNHSKFSQKSSFSLFFDWKTSDPNHSIQ